MSGLSSSKHKYPTLSEWIDAHDQHQTDVTRRKYDVYGHTKPLDRTWAVLYSIIWPILISIMIYYTIRITDKYENQKINPPTRVTFEVVDEIAFPQVTVCNWNQRDLNATSCDHCDLTLLQCDELDELGGQSKNCTDLWHPAQITVDNYGVFNCYLFNTDPDNPITTNNTGYDGSYVLVFGITAITNPPPNTILRNGLLATFTLPGVQPDLFNSDLDAPSGFDTFFTIREILQSHATDNGDNVIDLQSYSISNSLVQLPMTFDSKGHELVGVSFAMASLQRENIVAAPTYKLTNWWADFAAVLGAVLGLDLVKLMSSVIIFIAAWRKKRIAHLREHFM